MPEVLIRGGTVVDASGERRGRRAGRRGRADRGRRRRGLVRRPGCSTPAAAWSRPAWSSCRAHLGQPGREEAETVETGTRAAALGGFTAVVAMPNTDPRHRLRRRGPGGARPRRRRPLRGAPRRPPSPSAGPGDGRWRPMAELAELGVRLFIDEGSGMQDPGLLRRALEYARRPRRGRSASTPRPGAGRRAAAPTRGSGRPGSACPASRPRPRSWPSCATWPWPASPAGGCTSGA